ncbi:helix-turn-helix domain-containing protein [Patescibacteria group bacterium]|nr:helix-turn-helix domain-containing protein [Patescibacteria group bacterium]
MNRDNLIEILQKSVPNLLALTGGMGISFGEKKNFYPKAKVAAQTKKVVKDNNNYWIPLSIKDKVQIICGITSDVYPVSEIDLVTGLFKEFRYQYFLKKQVEKFIDPKSSFIKKILLTNEIKTMDEAIDNGDIVGVNLRSPQAVILIKVPGFLTRTQQKCELLSEEECSEIVSKECNKVIKAISQGFKKYDQNIITYLESEMFVVLKWAKGQVTTLNTIKFYKNKGKYIRSIVKKSTNLDPSIGVGQYYPGLKGLKKSYNDAKIALELGGKIFDKERVHHIADIGMFVSLSENVNFERKCELAHQILGEIISDKDLFRTLKIFLESNMNLTDAAKKLHLHRNTLIYRLDRIKADVGLDPRKFSDAIQIKLGLMLYSPLNNKCEPDQ